MTLPTTSNGARVIPGDILFKLKTTHGFPLEMSLELVKNDSAVVGWVEFIEAARADGWWDFQTYDCVCHALQDADYSRSAQDAIKTRMRIYMMKDLK